jgi:hypothetical protein
LQGFSLSYKDKVEWSFLEQLYKYFVKPKAEDRIPTGRIIEDLVSRALHEIHWDISQQKKTVLVMSNVAKLVPQRKRQICNKKFNHHHHHHHHHHHQI